jgi:hypothetical protein
MIAIEVYLSRIDAYFAWRQQRTQAIAVAIATPTTNILIYNLYDEPLSTSRQGRAAANSTHAVVTRKTDAARKARPIGHICDRQVVCHFPLSPPMAALQIVPRAAIKQMKRAQQKEPIMNAFILNRRHFLLGAAASTGGRYAGGARGLRYRNP